MAATAASFAEVTIDDPTVQLPGTQWWFGAGAGVSSLLWFAGLGYGARRVSHLLASTRAWQVLDVLIGLTMLAIAVKLAVG